MLARWVQRKVDYLSSQDVKNQMAFSSIAFNPFSVEPEISGQPVLSHTSWATA